MVEVDKFFEAITIRRPRVKQFLEKHGNESLAEYGQRLLRQKPTETYVRRFGDLEAVLPQVISRRTSGVDSQEVINQLRENPLISTVDHLGVLHHPFFLNAHLLLALSAAQSVSYKNVVVFANSTVSLNNSSYPKGLLLHDRSGELVRLPFFPVKDNMVPVFAAPAYSKKIIDESIKQVNNFDLSDTQKNNLISFLADVCASGEVFKSSPYSEQASKISGALWKWLVGSVNLPQLVYLDEEEIVLDLLARFHLNQETIINKILFHQSTRELFCKHFAGFPGDLDETGHGGTTLFWAIDPTSKKRVSLRLVNEILESKDGRTKIALNPKELAQAIENHAIMPSALLTFITLTFFYELACLGGFSQIDLLSRMQIVWQKFCNEVGEQLSSADSVVDRFGENLVLAYAIGRQNQLLPATMIDLLISGNENPWQAFTETAKALSVKKSFISLLPDMYRVLYREGERDLNFLRISAGELFTTGDLPRLIMPAAKL